MGDEGMGWGGNSGQRYGPGIDLNQRQSAIYGRRARCVGGSVFYVRIGRGHHLNYKDIDGV